MLRSAPAQPDASRSAHGARCSAFLPSLYVNPARLSLVDLHGQVPQRLADMRTQVFRRFEEGGDPLLSYPRFQRLEFLGTGSGIEIARPHRMIFVDEKDQPRLAEFDGATVF